MSLDKTGDRSTDPGHMKAALNRRGQSILPGVFIRCLGFIERYVRQHFGALLRTIEVSARLRNVIARKNASAHDRDLARSKWRQSQPGTAILRIGPSGSIA